MENKEFPKGIIFKLPKENAPDFVKGNLSFKVEEFIDYLNKNERNGWVNIDIKVSTGGKYYLDLNDWKPEPRNGGDGVDEEIIPF